MKRKYDTQDKLTIALAVFAIMLGTFSFFKTKHRMDAFIAQRGVIGK